MKPSKKFSLNKADLEAQIKSALIFLAPALIAFIGVLLPQIQAVVPVNQKEAFVIIILVWALNQVTGLLRRFVAGK